MGKDRIRVRGAWEHNLRGVDLDLPRESLTVFTGLSGSGKSSLAFDTIFKEGQRRFLQSLSSYARQFLGQMEKPRVELLEGLSPAVSIDQKGRGRNPRSTVGTITEIYDHLRLLFARLGTPHCPRCDLAIEALSPPEIVERLLLRAPGQAIVVMAPVVQDRKGEYRKELKGWLAAGFVRARIDGELLRLEDAPELDRYVRHSIELVLDRVTAGPGTRARLLEAVERALQITSGTVSFLRSPTAESAEEEDLPPGASRCPNGDIHELQASAAVCPTCGFSLPELEPRLFSFNTPHGACPACQGLGRSHEPDPEKMLPDPSRSLEQGALACLTADGKMPFVRLGQRQFEALAEAWGVSLDQPFASLPAGFQAEFLRGSTAVGKAARGRPAPRARGFQGVLPAMALAWKWTSAPFLERWMRIGPCTECGGTRLRPEARAVRFRGQDLGTLASWTVDRLAEWLEQIQAAGRLEEAVGEPLLRELRSRLFFLRRLGLGYVDLDRGAASLSGGEYQRIRLARQLGSRLQGVLYVLDEPSIGLHPRDNQRLLETLGELRDGGNTVLVVEHDEETMRAADHIVELGPDAGEHGGRVVAQGSPVAVAQADTHNGRFLSGRERIPLPARRRAPSAQQLVLRGARQHNLKNIDVAIPLGLFVALTGVSGSGKSTLVDTTLRRALARHFHGAHAEPGQYTAIEGLEHLDKVIEIDQSPIGRTPRSNPGTYTKVFDTIRDLFASLPEARARGYSKSRFSFNVPGGRCEECEGAGIKEVEMQFLAPVAVPCAACEGRRFNPETLEIRYRGRSITEVLEMTHDEALEFFAAVPALQRSLAILCEVGLGYLRLGQPSTTLSGGEAQRVKLASELRRPATGRTLYLLDEPSTGLHAHDVRQLLGALQRLVDAGNTVLLVEHNLEIVKVADWVIDLGPEAGDAGGEVVVAGPPEAVAACPSSHTGLALASLLRLGHEGGPSWSAAGPLAAEAVAEAAQRYVAVPLHQRARMRDLRVHHARQHNLKDLDLRIPGESLTVISGPSGSGKSSLAFHTIFAEGQRRYVESLSTYARRFLGRMGDADVERIDGLAPAIAIDQRNSARSPRSTVATATELHDHLRLLYARVGQPHCPVCDEPLEGLSPSVGARRVLARFSGETVLTCAPWPGSETFGQLRPRLLAEGILRVRLPDGSLLRCDAPPNAAAARRKRFELVLDRGSALPERVARLVEGIEAAYRWGAGTAQIYAADGGAAPPLVLRQTAGCSAHGVVLTEELSPRHFSFNHYKGACPTCAGLGRLGRGAAAQAETSTQATATESDAALDPDAEEAAEILSGELCPDCRGERLAPLSRAVRVGGWRLPQLTELSVAELRERVDSLRLGPEEAAISAELRKEVAKRLRTLDELGLGYLGLDRNAATLSGGEAQRLRLATQLGAQLSGCLYVLDEPTVGLHPRDTQRLLATLRGLRDQGNTVVMVEHDLESLRAADHIIDLGPGAGEDGGAIVAEGSPAELAERGRGLTADYLAGRSVVSMPRERRGGEAALELRGARANNLRGVDARFPWGALTCVTGVSGSGKSSLVVDVLRRAASQVLRLHDDLPGPFDELRGAETLQRMVVVDQSPIGRSPRSNPATYTGLLEDLRKLYARLPEAQARGYGAGRFSYNLAAGRCAACGGIGAIQVEMHFLSDIWLPCDTCRGRRYNDATLEVRYRGLSIADVLDLRVREAVEFLANHRRMQRVCAALDDVGLGYLRLGQSATTLSGGEAQRMKLAAELGRRGGPGSLYILDEPTTGLHLADVDRLLEMLHRLSQRGAAVVVVEHHPDVIKAADWVVDLGPEAGPGGGEVIVQGSPEAVAACERSHTGRLLGPLLAAARTKAAGTAARRGA